MKIFFLAAFLIFSGCATVEAPVSTKLTESKEVLTEAQELCGLGEFVAEEIKMTLRSEMGEDLEVKTEVFGCATSVPGQGVVYVRVTAMDSQMDAVTVFQKDRRGEWRAVGGGPVLLFNTKKGEFFLNIQDLRASGPPGEKKYDL